MRVIIGRVETFQPTSLASFHDWHMRADNPIDGGSPAFVSGIVMEHWEANRHRWSQHEMKPGSLL